MIETVLAFFSQELNSYFRSRFEINHDMVMVANLVGGEGKINSKTENKLVLSLIGIGEEKTTQSNSTQYARSGNRAIGRLSPALELNLSLLIAANFKEANYNEALKFISGAIGYFQVNRVFSRSTHPHLPPGMEKLTMEILSMDMDSQNNLWGMIGTHYLPSMVYRLRTIRVQESKVKEEVTPISGLRPEV